MTVDIFVKDAPKELLEEYHRYWKCECWDNFRRNCCYNNRLKGHIPNCYIPECDEYQCSDMRHPKYEKLGNMQNITFLDRDCMWCEGTGIYEALSYELPPEYTMNFANGRFVHFMRMLDLGFLIEDDLVGEIKGGNLDRARKRAMAILNGDVTRMNEDTFIDEESGKATMITMGTDERYWIPRLQQFLTLCREAKKLGRSLGFA